jgi:hypothetical protein
VHGCGLESLILGVNGGECMVTDGSNLGLFGGQLWCNNHPQNQQANQTPCKPLRPPGLSSFVLDNSFPFSGLVMLIIIEERHMRSCCKTGWNLGSWYLYLQGGLQTISSGIYVFTMFGKNKS